MVVTMVAAKMTELPQSHELRCLSPVMVTPRPAAFDTVWNNANYKRIIIILKHLLWLILKITLTAYMQPVRADTPCANMHIFAVEGERLLHAGSFTHNFSQLNSAIEPTRRLQQRAFESFYCWDHSTMLLVLNPEQPVVCCPDT